MIEDELLGHCAVNDKMMKAPSDCMTIGEKKRCVNVALPGDHVL